jgi:drug/metabolite transporter (DMT)-like permease
MDRMKIVAIVLMVAGVLGLAYGGFTYTEDTHEASVGPLKLSVDDKRHVNVPVWAGVGLLLVGGVMFAGGLKSK